MFVIVGLMIYIEGVGFSGGVVVGIIIMVVAIYFGGTHIPKQANFYNF